MAVDNPGVDQVSRPMQIALVAVVLLAGMWFTVLKPKPADDSAPAAAAPAATPASANAAAAPASSSAEPVAPGVKGLASAVDKAKAASATSDAANAKIQAATGASASSPTAAKPSTASETKTTAVKAATKHTAVKSATKTKATKPAAAKSGSKAATAAKPAADVDPSARLLAYLKQGKTLVILFEGKGADDKAARRAVHQTALKDPKHVVSAYVPISQVGKYEAITSDVQVLSAPTILVIGTDGKATPLTGYVDAAVVRQSVADARRAAAASK